MEDNEMLSPAEREIAIRHDCQTMQRELLDLLREVYRKSVMLEYLYGQIAGIERMGAAAYFNGQGNEPLEEEISPT